MWQGWPPHTSTIFPVERKVDFCVRAAGVERTSSCGIARRWRWGRCQRRDAGAARARVPDDDGRAGVRAGRQRRHAVEGRDRRPAAGVGDRAADARADRAGHDLGRPLRDLEVADGDLHQHLVGRRVGERIVGHVRGVAVALAAVPHDLEQVEHDRADPEVGVGRVEHALVGRVVLGALQQQTAEVHAADAEHGAGEVGRHRGQRAAEDPALRVAVVAQRARVDQRLAGGAEGRVDRETERVGHRPPEEHRVEDPLLEAVGEAREAVEVLEDAQGVGDVVLGHPAPRRRAEREVVLLGHVLDVAGEDLVGRAEQAVAVERDPRGLGQRGARDDADEGRHLGVVLDDDGPGVGRLGLVDEAPARARSPCVDRKHGVVSVPRTIRSTFGFSAAVGVVTESTW